jgi:micrococcal nuclease
MWPVATLLVRRIHVFSANQNKSVLPTGIGIIMDNQTFALVFLALFLLIAFLVRAIPAPDRSDRRDRNKSPTPIKRVKRLKDAKVARVIDGDTVIVVIDRRRTTIRLDGIDCPEMDQDWGGTAKAGLTKLIGGADVRVEAYGEDSDGKTIATIYIRPSGQLDLLNVNTKMVKLGHAWVSRPLCQHLPKKRQNELLRIQRWAQNKRVGLWRSDNPVPPWH